ncbi:MAG: hypothetical protein ACTSQJ_04320 [Promethearchaeota archaeon]
MILQEYSQLAQVSGLTATISLCIGFILGGIVLFKAIKTKQKIIFLFFLCIIFTLSPWYPSGGGYLYWLITGDPLPYIAYILIGTVFIPIAIIAWLDIYMTTINPEKKNIILITFGIYSVIFEIYVFYFLFFAPGAPVDTMLGVFDNPGNITDIDYKGFVLIYLSTCIIISVATGIHFAISSIKIKENLELIWKGRFLFIAFMLFGVAAIFDAIVEMEVWLLLIIRFVLMATTFFFYIGFILPKWIKNILNIPSSDSDTLKK